MLAFILPAKAQKKNDPVILTVEKENVTLSEFEAVYNKNNNVSANVEQKTPAEYMELFINYKLKVKEAEALGLDTVESYKQELQGYLKQLSDPYLVDKQYTEDMVREAYDRLQYDVKASHVLIRVEEDASPEDTLKAYKKITEIYNKAKAGADFGDLAIKNSEDPSAKQNRGELGYFTAFRMVYPFESAAYNTPVGSVSKPVRTSFGYHILKVEDKRPEIGEIRAAHIMVASKAGDGKDLQINAEKKINEIYERVLAGEDFGQLARMYSDDNGSKGRGGELPWFGSGRMVAEFENAAFALDSNGAISKPVRSQYGWHIIKRLDKKNIGSYEDEYKRLKSRVEKDRRGEGSKESLVKKLKADYKVKEYPKNLAEVESYVDSSFFIGSINFTKEDLEELDAPLIVINDKLYKKGKTTITQADFAKYIKSKSRKQKPISTAIITKRLYDEFFVQSILDYEKSVLKLKYPEYKALVQEYRDGILLFELMDQKVWKKAVKDSTGLEAFYEAHKTDYMWDDRLDATIYTCNSEENAKEVKEMLEAGKSDSAILATVNESSQLGVDIRDGKFTKKDMPVLEKVEWKEGIYSVNDKANYVVVVREVLPSQPKSLDEARGVVTSAYQSHLEKSWIEELRAKYTYEVNQGVLEQVKPL